MDSTTAAPSRRARSRWKPGGTARSRVVTTTAAGACELAEPAAGVEPAQLAPGLGDVARRAAHELARRPRRLRAVRHPGRAQGARNTLYGATPSTSRHSAIDHHSSRIRGALQCDDVAHSTSARTSDAAARSAARSARPSSSRRPRRGRSELAQDAGGVVGAVLEVEVLQRADAAPVAAVVEGEHAEAGVRERPYCAYQLRSAGPAVQQHGGRRRRCRARSTPRGRGPGRSGRAAARRAAQARACVRSMPDQPTRESR